MRRLSLLLVAAALAGLAQPVGETSAPAGLRRVLLGRSHEGRAIRAYRLGDPASEKVVLVVGSSRAGRCRRARLAATPARS